MQRALSNSEVEYQQLSFRIEQVSDPQYTEDLKERIVSLAHRIKKVDKNKKSLEIDQLQRGKALTRVAEAGESEMVVQLNDLKNSYSVLDNKVKETDSELEKNASLLQDKSTKLAEAKSLWKRIAEEATGYELSPEAVLNNLQQAAEARQEKYAQLKGKIVMLDKNVTSLKTKYAVNMHEYQQKISTLQTQVTQRAELLQKKNEYVKNFFKLIESEWRNRKKLHDCRWDKASYRMYPANKFWPLITRQKSCLCLERTWQDSMQT